MYASHKNEHHTCFVDRNFFCPTKFFFVEDNKYKNIITILNVDQLVLTNLQRLEQSLDRSFECIT